MARIMRDSIVPTDIPTDGTQLVAGYANGRYAWDQAEWDRFAAIPRATIDVTGAAGLKIGTHFRLWISTLDGTESVADMTGVTAVQYQGEDITGGHYDQSLVYDDAWAPGVMRPVLPPPVQQTRHGVLVELPDGATVSLASVDGGKTWK